jgi:WhiB family redox-sensing transcriptional regulator
VFVDMMDDLAQAAAADSWMSLGLCSQTDAETFFPVPGASPAKAKQICAGCLVRTECLAYALDSDISHGVWGGTTEMERRRLKPSAKAA